MNKADDDDDSIEILYRQEKLGEDVWIKFAINPAETRFQFYKGTITRMEAYYPDHDTSKPVEYQHYVYFGDIDDGYFNLTEYETTGYLKWSAREAEIETQRLNSSAINSHNNRAHAPGLAPAATTGAAAAIIATATSRSSSARPVPVTPEKSQRSNTQQQKRSHSSNNGRNVKVKREPEFGSVRSNLDDPSNDEINMDEFSWWIRHIHRGSNGGLISEANARSVLNRARDLVIGRGITYKNWPTGIMFHPQTVTLKTNFMALLAQAKAFERQHGRDKGNGWLLQHPIKKLALYKEYVQSKRYNRENPLLIS